MEKYGKLRDSTSLKNCLFNVQSWFLTLKMSPTSSDSPPRLPGPCVPIPTRGEVTPAPRDDSDVTLRSNMEVLLEVYHGIFFGKYRKTHYKYRKNRKCIAGEIIELNGELSKKTRLVRTGGCFKYII